MAVISLYFFHSTFLSSSPQSLSALNLSPLHFNGEALGKSGIRGKRGGRRRTSSFVVLSTHSNPKILKPNRRSRYGQMLSPYDSDDDHDGGDGVGEDEDSEDDWSSDSVEIQASDRL